MIGQPENHCSFSLFCGYSVKKKTPYLWVLSCLYLILFKNRPIVPDATLDQVDPLVFLNFKQKRKKWPNNKFVILVAKHVLLAGACFVGTF